MLIVFHLPRFDLRPRILLPQLAQLLQLGYAQMPADIRHWRAGLVLA